jgi:hypothetical protein
MLQLSEYSIKKQGWSALFSVDNKIVLCNDSMCNETLHVMIRYINSKADHIF